MIKRIAAILLMAFTIKASAETTLQESLDSIDQWLGVLATNSMSGSGFSTSNSYTYADGTVQSLYDLTVRNGLTLPNGSITSNFYADGSIYTNHLSNGVLDLLHPAVGFLDTNSWFIAYTTDITDTGTAGIYRELGTSPDYLSPRTASGAFSGARFTAQESGVYWFSATAVATVQGASPNNTRIILSKNGSAADQNDPREALPVLHNEPSDLSSAFLRVSGQVFWIVELDQADYVSLWAVSSGAWGSKLIVLPGITFMGGKL